MNFNNYDEIDDLSMGAPHVVILGSGASVAALPFGDKNGKSLPLMNNLVEQCDLKPILYRHDMSYDCENFEDLYSALYTEGRNSALQDIETAVFKYFYDLELPDYPTIYDLLVISLRPKDLIATFNWDPLLWQALQRNHRWASGPKVVFLHGNTAIGYCIEDRTVGRRGTRCSKCDTLFVNSKLLYPIKEKNYTQNSYIQASWEILKKYLAHAYLFTVFGYSAPDSDVEAINLMKEGWGPTSKRNLEQTEIIDIKNPTQLRTTWSGFTHTHHFEAHSKFADSIIARHPRRSCEAMWSQLMDVNFIVEHPIPITLNWDELRMWFDKRIAFEKEQDKEL